MKRTSWLVALLLVLLAGGCIRFWNLPGIPPGLYQDEAVKGTDAIRANETGEYRVFYTANNGREGFFINLVALSFRIFGVTVGALRLPAALIGTLGILGTWLLAREAALLYPRFRDQADLAGLLGAVFTAFSLWQLIFSRWAIRPILVPLCVAFALGFLLRGLRTRRALPMGLSGAFLGLGYHSYVAFRALPGVFAWAFALRGEKRRDAWRWVLLLGCAVLVALPIAIFWIRNPEWFLFRSRQVSIFTQGSWFANLGTSVAATIGMFLWRGDSNWRHNIAGRPELAVQVLIFFLPALVLLVVDFIGAIRRRRREDLLAPSILLAALGATLLPHLLSMRPLPHAIRAIAAIPVVHAIAALGCAGLYGVAPRGLLRRVLLALLLVSLAATETWAYFGVWAREPQVRTAFFDRPVRVAGFLNGLPAGVNRYAVANTVGVPIQHRNPDGGVVELPMPAETTIFLLHGHPPATWLLYEEVPGTAFRPPAVVVPLYDSLPLLEWMQERIPGSVPGENSGIRFLRVE